MVGKSLLALMLVACGSKPFPIEEDAGRTTDAAKMDAPGPDGCTMTAWYVDQDGDGYGRSYNYQMACQAPNDGQRWVQMGGDCADQDKDTNPSITAFSSLPIGGPHTGFKDYDHNCDGKEADEFPATMIGKCSNMNMVCTLNEGWYQPGYASCGMMGTWVVGCGTVKPPFCEEDGPTLQHFTNMLKTQACN